MGKPHIESYKRFCKMFYDFTGKENKDQYVVPYLMSSHPGSTLSDAVVIAFSASVKTFTTKQVTGLLSELRGKHFKQVRFIRIKLRIEHTR